MPTFSLQPHPATPCAVVRAIEVELQPSEGLALAWHIHADARALRIPPQRPALRREGLWRTSCCELFVRGGGDAYREFNFSPSGEWAAYGFARYREGMQAIDVVAPRCSLRLEAAAIVLEVALEASALPGAGDETLRIGPCCVIEAADGSLSYWALAHPAARPDFHHAGSFALDLARVAGA